MGKAEEYRLRAALEFQFDLGERRSALTGAYPPAIDGRFDGTSVATEWIYCAVYACLLRRRLSLRLTSGSRAVPWPAVNRAHRFRFPVLTHHTQAIRAAPT